MKSPKRIGLFARHWGAFLVLAFWCAVGIANLLGKVPPSAPASFRWRGTHTDFDALYAVAVAAKADVWDAIYSPDIKTAANPAGVAADPRLQALLEPLHAPYRAAWMYPPPAVVPLFPLSFFGYPAALGIWMALNAAALVWLVFLLQSEFGYHHVPESWSNLLTVVFGAGMPVGAVLNTQNLSLWFAVASLLVIKGLRKPSTAGPVFGFVQQGVTKGFSAIWIPLLFIWRKWFVVAWGGIVSAFLVGFSFLLGCTVQTYARFFTDVVPAVKSATFIRGDGFPAFLKHLSRTDALPSWMSGTCSVLLLGLLAFVYFLSWRFERLHDRSPDDMELFRELAIFLSFLLFQSFSNVCWSFYRVHLLAFLPLCTRLCMQQKRFAPLFAVSMAILWMPMLDKALSRIPASSRLVSALTRCPGFVGYALLLLFASLAFLATFHRKPDNR